jgi:hypothetical protein
VKIRLWGTADECRQMAQLLIDAPGFEVVSVSEPRVDRGASVLVRVYIEARLTPPVHVTCTTEPAHGRRYRVLPRGADPLTTEMRQ